MLPGLARWKWTWSYLEETIGEIGSSSRPIAKGQQGYPNHDRHKRGNQRLPLGGANSLKLARPKEIDCEAGTGRSHPQQDEQPPQLSFSHHSGGNYNTPLRGNQFELHCSSAYNTIHPARHGTLNDDNQVLRHQPSTSHAQG